MTCTGHRSHWCDCFTYLDRAATVSRKGQDASHRSLATAIVASSLSLTSTTSPGNGSRPSRAEAYP
jgi:hypothetical protein